MKVNPKATFRSFLGLPTQLGLPMCPPRGGMVSSAGHPPSAQVAVGERNPLNLRIPFRRSEW